MFILFLKSQLGLFDMPTMISGSVKKDGTIVAPHMGIRRKRMVPLAGAQADMFGEEKKEEQTKRRSALDALLRKYGGAAQVAVMMRGVPDDQRDRALADMAKIAKVSVAEMQAALDAAKPDDATQGDLFAAPVRAENLDQVPVAASTEKLKLGDIVTITGKYGKGAVGRVTSVDYNDTVMLTIVDVPKRSPYKKGDGVRRLVSDLTLQYREQPSEPNPEPTKTNPKTDAAIIKYTTRKGKTLTGIIQRGITLEQAKEIDPYAFRLDGGMFIREKHLGLGNQNPIKKETPAATSDEANKQAVDQNPIKKPADLPSVETASAPVASTEQVQPLNPLAFGVPAGTSKADRRRLNAAAAELVSDGRTQFDEHDRAILRQYSGNGGCGDSLNEFYTDPAIAKAIWDVATRLGYESGTAGEFSCGTGVFLHTAPSGFKVTGVELDPVSASIATALHGDRHEIINASLERFATQDMRRFDVVIGNPPYGPRGRLAKDDKIELSKAEEYFIDTSLDKTAPGGFCSLVVPAGIMDSQNGRGFRERILRKAEFLGAQRMPNTAFEAAHTDVTADILYFRKRPDDVAGALATVDKEALQSLGVWDDEFLSGAYFGGRGGENVFGTVGTAMRAFGEIYTVNGSMLGVADEVAKFEPNHVGASPSVPDILAALPDEAAKNRALNGAKTRPYEVQAKVGDIRTIEGVTYVLQGNPPRWHRIDEALQTDAVTDAQSIANQIDRLMSGGDVDREQLQADIKAWVATHGIPAKNQHLLVAAATDKSLYRLIGAVGKNGTLSDAVRGKAAVATEGGFDTIARALALNHDDGSFTSSALAERLGKDGEEVLDRLVADSSYAYVPPVGKGLTTWAPMDVYLTGELWTKLDHVREMLASGNVPDEIRDKLEFQAKRLEETIDPKSLEDVDFSINSAFLPTSVLEAWLNSQVDEYKEKNKGSQYAEQLEPAKVSFDKGVYSLSGGMWGNDLLEKYLNRTGVRKDDIPALDDKNQAFRDWLCASPLREEVEELYNRKFRGFVQRDFSNEPIDVPGLANKDKIKDYTWSGLRWLLATGKGICAADVGLGKTIRGLLLARLAKIEGRAQKPVITVPKSVLANWYAETQKWFPGSKVLTIGATFEMQEDGTLKGRDDNANERKRKYHDLSQNDYDFVIISEPVFEELDLDPVTKEEYYSQDFWVQRGESLGNAGDKRRKKIREQYEQALAKREFTDRTDAIYFNEIGIDMLIADEMHHQKNLYAAKNRFGESPKFLGGQGLSNRALDFNLKTRWLLKEHGNKGVYGLTATPTKNSPLEIYSMLCHVAPEAWESIGVRNSEEFLDRFCVFQKDTVLSTGGEIEDALVTAGFKNMNELREIMKRYIDRTTAEQVGLVLPKRDDHMHFVDMTEAQETEYAKFREMLEDDAKKKDATGDSHIFSIMDKMNKAALDLEILDPKAHKGAASPKYKSLAKHVAEGVRDGGQVVFSDYIDSHDKIVDALVASGIPREQIGVINAQVAGAAVKRQNIADRFNAGKLRVVIGNTATMGEGINLQMGTADIHHLDLPWEPASMQQRNGRGLRQGNINEAVRIHTYLSKGSFDGYRYQSIAAKKDWQDLLWSGGDRVDNLAREGKFSRQDIQIMMAADPEAAREKFENDKALAMAQHESGERVKAAEVYVRFQELKAGYNSLKNKNTKSAAMLKQKIENAKTSLKSNRFFTAKHTLDSDVAAVIQPQTGEAFSAGVAFHAKADDGQDEGKFVVTGVNVRAGTVTVRPYASTSGGVYKTVELSKLAHGVTPFKFDAEAEGKEVAAEMERMASDRVNNIEKWEDIKTMPSSVLTAANDSIQRQMFDGAKSYKVRFPYGKIPMIHKETGKIDPVDQYSIKDKESTHEFLLPTDSNKEKAIQAWMDEERTKRYGQTTFQRRKNSRTEWRNRVEYPNADYNSKTRNPITSVLEGMEEKPGGHGIEHPLVKQAKERFIKEQLERVRQATTFKDALAAAVPLSSFPDHDADEKTRPIFNKRTLAMLWARAKHEGILDSNFEDYVPSEPSKWSAVPSKVHNSYAWHKGGYNTDAKDVHGRLMAMINGSGHKDLYTAVKVSALRHGKGDPAEVLAHLDKLGVEEGAQNHYQVGRGPRRYPKGTFDTMLKIAESAGLADTKLKDAGINSWGILSTGHKTDSYLTIREAIEKAKKESA